MEHKTQQPNTGLLDFLAAHYQKQQPIDKDYDRDMKLPFKTMGECQSMPAYTLPPMAWSSIENLPTVLEKQNYISLNQSVLSTYLANIWQPPRFS